MTRKQFEDMEFEDLMYWANENIDGITDDEMLKECAISNIHNDSFNMVLHIINALNESPCDTIWYRYDYSMGTLQTPSPIADKEDIEDLIFFDDEE